MGKATGKQIARAVLGICCALLTTHAQAQAQTQAQAQPLEDQLERTLAAQPGRFIGYETVPYQPGNAISEKFLVLDFRFPEPQSEKLLQASVHKICQAVLLDQRLVNTLSAGGYDRLAVAFDRDFQYDCF